MTTEIKVLRNLSYGMYAISVTDGQRPTGCIVNTVFQITSENPIVAVSLNKNNYTYQVIKQTGRFSVSILSEQTNRSVITTLGFTSGKDKDKFEGLKYHFVDNLPVLEEECSGALICDVVSMTETPTHIVILGKVVQAEEGKGAQPMTYRYYHEVVKGGTPKNAPSYVERQEEESAGQGVEYVCKICGYVHKGDIAAEPEDYTCPICGVSKSNFTKKN